MKLTVAEISRMSVDVDTIDCLLSNVSTHNKNNPSLNIPVSRAVFALHRLKKIVDDLQNVEVKVTR